MDIKLILGEEFGPEKWQEIKDSGEVPLYLQDIEINTDAPLEKRLLPKDTHLLEEDIPEQNGDSLSDDYEDDLILQELNESQLMNQLNALHDAELLNEQNVRLQDISRLYNSIPTIVVTQPSVDDDNDEDNLENINADPARIRIENILPEGTKRRK